MINVTHIAFDIQQDIESLGGFDPDDSWSRDSTDGTVTVHGARRVDKDRYGTLSVAGDIAAGTPVFLVWAQYSTGDSFGSDGGQYELLEVLTDKTAAEARAAFYRSVTDYSVPWNGYFENLDFVRVDDFILGAE